jgi:hypothetical protein
MLEKILPNGFMNKSTLRITGGSGTRHDRTVGPLVIALHIEFGEQSPGILIRRRAAVDVNQRAMRRKPPRQRP